MRDGKDEVSPFDSYDPAHPSTDLSVERAGEILLNISECLYRRYSAMFYLRNTMTGEAVHILGRGLAGGSPLFKHEIAFVFGQMRMNECVTYLKLILEDESEHGMVRHECAEALGAIGTEESKGILLPYINSNIDIVRESVEVALDIHAYENSGEAEYAVT
jgi:deoxyhypusine monooxygenase